jgi:hypothetical protein
VILAACNFRTKRHELTSSDLVADRDLAIAENVGAQASPVIMVHGSFPAAQTDYRGRMRFEQRLREGIHDGTITVAFRRWKRHQLVAGGQYRTGAGMVAVDAVDIVDPAKITKADARRAGYRTVDDLVRDLRGDQDAAVYRIRLRPLAEPDPRSVLAADGALSAADIAEIARRLDRLDKASPRGPWTGTALRLIAEHPDVVATELAATAGLPRDIFKRNVRSLKGLGLTLSQPVGYRLSPRGAAYLAAADSARLHPEA